jgi:beta-lactamase class A
MVKIQSGLALPLVLGLPFLLGGRASAQGDRPPLARLEQRIEFLTRHVDAQWGIFIKSLDTGEEIALNADAAFDTMSVIKIPIMVEAFRQIESGKLALSDRITLKESDLRFGTGVLRSLDPGAEFSVKDAIMLMNIVSDNTATDLMFERVGGPARVTAAMRELGFSTMEARGTTFEWFRALSATADSSYAELGPLELFRKGPAGNAASRWKFHSEAKHPFGLSSAREMGLLLEKIYRHQVVSKASCEMMLDIMGRQVYSSRLPRYLGPLGYRVPHKTGDFLPFIGNDAGYILSPDVHLVIVVFDRLHQGDPVAFEDTIGRIAEAAATFFDLAR